MFGLQRLEYLYLVPCIPSNFRQGCNDNGLSTHEGSPSVSLQLYTLDIAYNFRSYFVQRTQHVFKDVLDGCNDSSPERLRAVCDEMKKELEVLKRAAVMNQLYGGGGLVVETLNALPAAEKYERGDT